MSQSNSISDAISRLRENDSHAAELIWRHFFARLCKYAESKIYRRHRRIVAPEEVASSAFMALMDGVRNDRFKKVRNRDELWQMLTLIAARKAINANKRHDRQKRRPGSPNAPEFSGDGVNNVADFIEQDLGPQQYAELVELSRNLLQSLPGEDLRKIAIWRMAGFSNAEIAEKQKCVERTVERKLRLIRELWSELAEESSDE